MDERTIPPIPADVTNEPEAVPGPEAVPTESAPPTEVATPTEEAAPPGQASSERGFPGFPVGDPEQLPLSQRPRGLDAVPPRGGRDPEIRATLARERPYVRLLVGMVAVIVGGSLLLTFLALLSAAFLR